MSEYLLPSNKDIPLLSKQSASQQLVNSPTGNMQWEEDKHPRANDGKFGSGGGSSQESEESTAPVEEDPYTRRRSPEELKQLKQEISIAKIKSQLWRNFSEKETFTFFNKYRDEDSGEFNNPIIEKAFNSVIGFYHEDFKLDNIGYILSDIASFHRDYLGTSEEKLKENNDKRIQNSSLSEMELKTIDKIMNYHIKSMMGSINELYRSTTTTELDNMLKYDKLGVGGGSFNYICTSVSAKSASWFGDDILIEFDRNSIPDEYQIYQGYSMFNDGDSVKIGESQGMNMAYEGELRLAPDSIDVKSTKMIIYVNSVIEGSDEAIQFKNKYGSLGKIVFTDEKQSNSMPSQQAAINPQWEEDKHPRADDGKFGGGGAQTQQEFSKPTQNNVESDEKEKLKDKVNKAKELTKAYTDINVGSIWNFFDEFRNKDNENGYAEDFKYEIIQKAHDTITELDDIYPDELNQTLTSISHFSRELWTSGELENEDMDYIIDNIDNALNYYIKEKINSATKLFRGTSTKELDSMLEHGVLGKGGGKYDFICTSLVPEVAQNLSNGVVIEFKKNTIPEEYQIYQGYSFHKEGDTYDIGEPQGGDMVYEGEIRLAPELIDVNKTEMIIHASKIPDGSFESKKFQEKYGSLGRIIFGGKHEISMDEDYDDVDEDEKKAKVIEKYIKDIPF